MRSVLVPLALLAVAGLALADPPVPGAPSAPGAKPQAPAPAAKPAPPLTPEQAADAVLVAVKAKDDVALKALALKDDPDPWLVADELIRRSEHDAAETFAKAVPRVDVEKLPEYVASRRGKADDAARRARLAAANAALAAGKPDEALVALGEQEPGPIEDVVGVRLAMGKAIALSRLSRWQGAAAAFRASGEAAERIGWLARADVTYNSAAMAARTGASFSLALAAAERRLAICERRSDKAGAAQALSNIGSVYAAVGEFSKALASVERARAALEALGDLASASVTINQMGAVYEEMGDHPRALEMFQQALSLAESSGAKVAAAMALGNIGYVHSLSGHRIEAVEILERAFKAKVALGDQVGAATTLANLGKAYADIGDFASALSSLERALGSQFKMADRIGSARTQDAIGIVHWMRGDYAMALASYERSLAAMEALGDRRGATRTLAHIGVMYNTLGDYDRALRTQERILAAQNAMSDGAGAATTMCNLGLVAARLGEHDKALAFQERALAAMQALGDSGGVARTLGYIGVAYSDLGDYKKALSFLEQARTSRSALGDVAGAALVQGNIGNVQYLQGDFAKALSTYQRLLAATDVSGYTPEAVTVLGNIGLVQLALGDLGGALASSRKAVLSLALLARGLGSEEGATAREPLGFVYDVGALASVAANDTAELSFFLESGRAGALLEGLASRHALWSADVPADLQREELRVRAAEASASTALERALRTQNLADIEVRRAELGAARERVSGVIARIQRESKSGASIVYPVVATLEEVRATLVSGDVLVMYGVPGSTKRTAMAGDSDPKAYALVVTPGGARIVSLATPASIRAAVGNLALGDASVDPTKALSVLAQLVVEPLGIPRTTKRVLVSPAGELARVPFASLLPYATVVYAASGTTYRTIRADRAEAAEGVLALGDPSYATQVSERAAALIRGASGRLSPLPGTRDEVLAVGTVALLGGDATEAELASALAKRPRWRAVHLACHGLLNMERPALSSLAITAAGDDDGLLTCLDVFRMKIPADLVVLSACDTGRGKVVNSEGIVGLTRAFMFAGAPRVICSLWKVDDAATKALMVKFYELWNPKDASKAMGTAAALKAAQEYVRTYETEVPDVDASQREGRAVTKRVRPWEHPYYWAAWVLWGLPD